MNHRVLVVDDILEVRALLTLILQGMGHDVQSVGSARQALSMLNNYPAQVIFSDLSMPEMSGYEFVRVLRLRPDTRYRFIIAMTANGGASTERASLEAGFDAHLAKPFDMDTIRELFAHPKAQALQTDSSLRPY